MIHVFTMYMWQHVSGTFIGLQVAYLCIHHPGHHRESSSLPFNQGHFESVDIHCLFTEQAPHHTTECLGMDVLELEMH